MLGFNLDAKTFVATATAIALIVDGARMPIYFFTSPETVHRLATSIVIMVAGVIIGTLAGECWRVFLKHTSAGWFLF